MKVLLDPPPAASAASGREGRLVGRRSDGGSLMVPTCFASVTVRGLLVTAALLSAVPVWAVLCDVPQGRGGEDHLSSPNPPGVWRCASTLAEEPPKEGTLTGGLDCEGAHRIICPSDHL